jgi:prefoldin alpha subunit|tara:strand:- start:56 stop:457 length:402 start_codon:yes stop_codon:yes gene_type:complete
MEEKSQQEQQEIMFKLSMFEQQIQQIQQQLQSVEQGIIELNSLNLGLDEMVGKEGKEIFASIGKGIFAKAKLISEDLIVDIGDKNLVKKTIPETQKLVKNQIEKLEEVKKELDNNLETTSNELRSLIQSVDKN